jgi:hypothetical protein
MKISKADLAALEKDGAVVKRALGKQPPPKKRAAKPKKKPPAKTLASDAKKVENSESRAHASMQASMRHSESQIALLNRVVEQNSEIVNNFAESVKALRPQEPSPYTFDVKRDDDGLLERVYARPGILTDDIKTH